MSKEKVLVGMSGGVDSSAAAAILLEQGYDVSGCTLRLSPRETEDGGCCSMNDVYDAKSVCRKLGIDHYTFNMKDSFEEYVMRPFAESYIHGETPNPCILCNKHIKFDLMLKRAELLGFDRIATGHYAGVRFDEKTGKYSLVRSEDMKKDQTYVLYSLTQEQLSKTLFPLSGITKEEVRKLADKYDFVNSDKPDSQDICFVPDGDHAGFICGYTRYSPSEGNFIDNDGNILGKHGGIIKYTIGQRRGLGVTFGKPVFVTEKNAENNTVVLGSEEELMSSVIYLKDVNIISGEPLETGMQVTAKTRYSAREQQAAVYPLADGRARVEFTSPVRAAAPGQACVFYSGQETLGGGRIEYTEKP